MAGFLYFLPCDTPPTRERLGAVGFDHADVAALPGCGVTKGPDGGPGYAFTLGSPPHSSGATPATGYFPDRQTWRRVNDWAPWLGWETEAPPTPEDLERQRLAEGHRVTLEDGNEWLVPVIRSLVGDTTLPTILDFNGNGSITRNRVLPQFARIWDLTRRAYAAVEKFDPTLIGEDEAIELACAALAMNYRVSKWEIGALGILTTENHKRIFAAIIDIPASALEEG